MTTRKMLALVIVLLVAPAALAQQTQSAGGRPERLVVAAIDRTKHDVTYDGSYHRLAYPLGDVPANIGVCTDVVIRAYRAGLGIDLQQRVHEDMKRDFGKYPKIWGLSRPDPNIDHRRVPNLEIFLKRHGETLPITDNPEDYKPGDLVTWRLTGTGLPHIGIVTDRRAPITGNPIIAHNIGRGPELGDMLFDYRISGHFRYLPTE
ncbi:MAG: DUF1287 domain-containing protein [Alphaproteobacteria bacterium]|nr:DUF1287 domain-containing protein [Alphaproteobacteria bacterium]